MYWEIFGAFTFREVDIFGRALLILLGIRQEDFWFQSAVATYPYLALKWCKIILQGFKPGTQWKFWTNKWPMQEKNP